MASRRVARQHDDLDVWRLCSEIRGLVLKRLRDGPAAADRRYRSQLSAAVRSACNLVSEGFYRNRDGDFINFLVWSRASLGEAADQINDGVDSGYFTDAERQQLIALIKRAFGANRELRRYLEASRDKQRRGR